MKQVISDIWKALVFVWNGAKKDPKRWATEPPDWWHCATPEGEVKERKLKFERANPDAVSYTHLTLPTIYSV